MKQLIVFLSILLLLNNSYAQQSEPKIMLIPEPVSLQEGEGQFILPERIGVSIPVNVNTGNTFQLLKSKIIGATGYAVDRADNKEAKIIFKLNNKPDPALGREGYMLEVKPDKVNIVANEAPGLFYGAQTLLQLLPPEIESKEKNNGVAWKIPVLKITDYPRVKWRGLMLDVSRHFFTVDEVKRFIDNMSRFKYNVFHFHLTDDQGWRLEIKSLPKLTEIGAWRVDKTGIFGTFSKPDPTEPRKYGGYYTQEQIKELVKYAADRFVNILPEIDVPGHSLAAIAAYPELSCTEGADKYAVNSGESFMDWSHGAPPIALEDNTLCPANEKVYGFMEKVFTEVASLFPFEYIHVGGDEAPHNFWEKSPQVKALMAREKLTTIPHVQSYFEKRIEKIINKTGKKMLGWDELMEGGVNKSTAIMSWRGEKAGIEASRAGHAVVMSPTKYAYLDYMQGDISTEPPVYASLRLSDTYKFNPVPQGADARYILGGQANLWTEQIYNYRQVEYMIWPRALAIAESVWSPAGKKDWKKFANKTQYYFTRFDNAKVKYSKAIYDPIITVSKKDSIFYVDLKTEINGLDIYTSFDNSEPDNYYPKYTAPLAIPKDAFLLKIITYRNGVPVGRLMTIRVDDLKKRAK